MFKVNLSSQKFGDDVYFKIKDIFVSENVILNLKQNNGISNIFFDVDGSNAVLIFENENYFNLFYLICKMWFSLEEFEIKKHELLNLINKKLKDLGINDFDVDITVSDRINNRRIVIVSYGFLSEDEKYFYIFVERNSPCEIDKALNEVFDKLIKLYEPFVNSLIANEMDEFFKNNFGFLINSKGIEISKGVEDEIPA